MHPEQKLYYKLRTLRNIYLLFITNQIKNQVSSHATNVTPLVIRLDVSSGRESLDNNSHISSCSYLKLMTATRAIWSNDALSASSLFLSSNGLLERQG